MKRFTRLRKTARKLAQQNGHSLGIFYLVSDLKYEAKCIDCGLHCLVCDRQDIKINKDKAFNNPFDTTPMYASKLNDIVKQELQIDLYGPKQTGYILGPALLVLCKENPFIPQTPIMT